MAVALVPEMPPPCRCADCAVRDQVRPAYQRRRIAAQWPVPACGHHGALIQMPSHHSMEVPYKPFPVEHGMAAAKLL